MKAETILKFSIVGIIIFIIWTYMGTWLGFLNPASWLGVFQRHLPSQTEVGMNQYHYY